MLGIAKLLLIQILCVHLIIYCTQTQSKIGQCILLLLFILAINESSANPCQNGGNLKINNGCFRCACAEGWTGAFCNQGECIVIPISLRLFLSLSVNIIILLFFFFLRLDYIPKSDFLIFIMFNNTISQYNLKAFLDKTLPPPTPKK